MPDSKIKNLYAPFFYELAGEVFISLNPAGLISSINEAGAALLGLPREEIIGRNWIEEFIPELERRNARRAFGLFSQGDSDEPSTFQSSIVCANGQSRKILWRNYAFRDATGFFIAEISAGLDFTESERTRANLVASETRFEAAFEQSVVGMALVSLDGRFIRVNRKISEILGYSEAELKDRTFQEITHSDDLSANQSGGGSWLDGRTPPFKTEIRCVHKDGARVWTDLTVSIVRDAEGQPAYYSSVMEDITLRKQFAALRVNEHIQRMSLAAAHAGAWKWEGRTGVQVWTPKVYEIFNIDPAEEPPNYQAWLDKCVVPADRAIVEEAISGVVNTRGGDFRVEFRTPSAHTGYKWIVSFGRLILDREYGPIAYGTFVDVSDRRRADELLHQSEERLRLAAEIGEIGVWDWDITTGQIDWSHAAALVFGRDPQEFRRSIGGFRSFVHPDDRSKVRNATDTALAGSGEYRIEYRFLDQEGHYRWISSQARVLHDDAGRPTRMIGVNLNITKQKAAEEWERQITLEMGHRVKNIISVVHALASQSLTAGSDPETFLARLSALATAHSLLVNPEQGGGDLSALVRKQLAPFPAERVTIAGPPVVLSIHVVQTFVLVLHELATNASKYGALSRESGTVSANWSILDEASKLKFVWAECGGPHVSRPERTGFGTDLIRACIQYELGGIVSLEYRAEGFRAEFTIPLHRLT